jgi:hypothetical protein
MTTVVKVFYALGSKPNVYWGFETFSRLSHG